LPLGTYITHLAAAEDSTSDHYAAESDRHVLGEF